MFNLLTVLTIDKQVLVMMKKKETIIWMFDA